MTLHTRDLSIDVPGGVIFARQWWPDEAVGLPIILLHDSLGAVELWRDFPVALANATSRPVIAYDRLGYGQSTQRTDELSFDFIRTEAERYLPAVAAAFDLDRYVLFGHSVGGGIALTAGACLGAACAAIITESAQAYVEERTRAGIRAAKKSFEDPAQFEKLTRLHGDRAQWVLDAWTEVWTAQEFRDWSLDDALPQVTCPVLAIHGDQDEFGSCAFPEHIVAGVSGAATMAIVAGSGHVPHRQERAQVLAAVQSFLQDNAVA